MLSVTQICKRYKAGEALADIIPQDADRKFWQRIVDNYVDRPRRKQSPRRGHRSTRQPASKKTNYAAQVIERNAATLELVKRANAKAAQQRRVIARIERRDFIAIKYSDGSIEYQDRAVA